MFSLLPKALLATFRSLPELIIKGGAVLFALFLSNLIISIAAEIGLQKNYGESSLVIIEVFGLLLTSGFDALFFLFLLLTCHQLSAEFEAKLSFGETVAKLAQNLSQIVIEFLRSIASIIRWSLLLLLPGLFKQVTYTFVPLVVLFDQEYQQGHVDALQRSQALCRKIFLVLVSFLMIDVLVTSFLDAKLIIAQLKSSPIIFAISAGSLFLFKVFMTSLLFQLFRHQFKMQTQENVANNSTETGPCL